jgi:hypothetical protein
LGNGCIDPHFLTSALVGGEWSASRPARFIPGERAPSTLWIEGWVDPRAGLDDVEKRKFLTLLGLELRPIGRLARSQSLYRLSYLGPPNSGIHSNGNYLYIYILFFNLFMCLTTYLVVCLHICLSVLLIHVVITCAMHLCFYV